MLDILSLLHTLHRLLHTISSLLNTLLSRLHTSIPCFINPPPLPAAYNPFSATTILSLLIPFLPYSPCTKGHVVGLQQRDLRTHLSVCRGAFTHKNSFVSCGRRRLCTDTFKIPVPYVFKLGTIIYSACFWKCGYNEQPLVFNTLIPEWRLAPSSPRRRTLLAYVILHSVAERSNVFI